MSSASFTVLFDSLVLTPLPAFWIHRSACSPSLLVLPFWSCLWLLLDYGLWSTECPLDLFLDHWIPLLDPHFVFRTPPLDCPTVHFNHSTPLQLIFIQWRWHHLILLRQVAPTTSAWEEWSTSWTLTPTSSCKTTNLLTILLVWLYYRIQKPDSWQQQINIKIIISLNGGEVLKSCASGGFHFQLLVLYLVICQRSKDLLVLLFFF